MGTSRGKTTQGQATVGDAQTVDLADLDAYQHYQQAAGNAEAALFALNAALLDMERSLVTLAPVLVDVMADGIADLCDVSEPEPTREGSVPSADDA